MLLNLISLRVLGSRKGTSPAQIHPLLLQGLDDGDGGAGRQKDAIPIRPIGSVPQAAVEGVVHECPASKQRSSALCAVCNVRHLIGIHFF